MSGHVLQYNPQSKAYVRRGMDGKFAPKVITQAQPSTVQKYPATNQEQGHKL
jgi:hypothetical protein